MFTPKVTINIVPIDDFYDSPRVLHIQQRHYFNFMLRIRPLYIRIKIFWSREQLFQELYTVLTDGSIWTAPTFEYGNWREKLNESLQD